MSILFVAGVAGLAGCQAGDQPAAEYVYNMQNSKAYKAFRPNEGTANGITLQRPVPGTIARGYRPLHYGKGEAEAIRAGNELTDPFHPTEQVLAKGKALFRIYCMVCHGEQGKGDGPISTKIPPPPSYKADRLLQYPPGRIFHVISTGAGKMPSYAVQIQPDERWLIVTYVRAVLQGLPEAPPGSNPPVPPNPAVENGPVPTFALNGAIDGNDSTAAAPAEANPGAPGSGGSR